MIDIEKYKIDLENSLCYKDKIIFNCKIFILYYNKANFNILNDEIISLFVDISHIIQAFKDIESVDYKIDKLKSLIPQINNYCDDLEILTKAFFAKDEKLKLFLDGNNDKLICAKNISNAIKIARKTTKMLFEYSEDFIQIDNIYQDILNKNRRKYDGR